MLYSFPPKLRDHHGRRGREFAKAKDPRENETLSLGHDRAAALVDSQQPQFSVQDQFDPH